MKGSGYKYGIEESKEGPSDVGSELKISAQTLSLTHTRTSQFLS